AGFPNVIGLDMGGTSCDIGLVKDGELQQTIKSSVGKWDMAIPMLDVNTISAGGGTIARVDGVGNLVLGPDSAGADPGPVCYGKGGQIPTVTDANLVLGYLSPDNLLAGKMKLDKEAAEKAITEKIAKPLGLSLLEAADGIIRVINADMEQGVRAVSAEKGYDPRDFVLFAFGGAGPVHAARLAAALNIPKVMAPIAPGVTSALGLLLADVRHDYVRSHLDPLAALDPEMVNRQFKDLAEKAVAEMKAEGFSPEQVQIANFMDMRYAGQGYEITVPAPSGVFDKEMLNTMRSRFDAQHERLFGHKAETQPVEVVSYRLVSTVAVPKPKIKTYPKAGDSADKALKGQRQVYFGRDTGSIPCAIYDRERLQPGHKLNGPAIVDQMDSTTVIYPGQTAVIDAYRNIIISVLEG
ncbi:MAG: hydantoinase/oxoprolinase family protein, partial [Chloroflexota bacterium]